jgi:hypothetical protein
MISPEKKRAAEKRAIERRAQRAIAQDAIARERAGRCQDFQLYFTNLITSWANCESWFIDVLAVLLRTDQERAAAILYSIVSTRARVELVQRLGIMCLPTADLVRRLNRICKGFKKVTTLRNTLCHSQYSWYGPAEGWDAIKGFSQFNFAKSNFDGTNYREETELDDDFLKELRDAIIKVNGINRQLRRFKVRVAGRVLKRPREWPLQLEEHHKPKVRRPHPGRRRVPKRQRQPSRG